MENKMNEYLGSQYSSDSIRNFLIYRMKPAYPRYKNDLDCIYYNGNVNADTLFSGWIPMKYTLKILNPGHKFPKEYDTFKNVYENQEEFLPSQNELVMMLRDFLKLAEEKQNYFLLPDSKINRLRGCDWDWVPKFMQRLFTDDRYRCHFENKDAVISWIKKQKLNVCFKDGIIDEQHIDLILPGNKISFSRNQTQESMKIILQKYCEILSNRALMIQNDIGIR